MPLTPAMIERVTACAAEAADAGHGGKQAVYQRYCTELGISLPTLHRYLGQTSVRAPRRQRSDAGQVALERSEAILISAVLMESLRKNGKQLYSVRRALQAMRADGLIRADRSDPATGEITPLSDSAVASALRQYGLHPDQLLAPAPAVSLRSLHPNHVWQIDASLCVLYYLHGAKGLQVMEREKFYKNKPANLKAIENDRVWSYETVDHYSGALAVHYVMGAESATNLTESFLRAICQTEGDPFHGVPLNLMLDKGSANTSGAFRNLCRRLGVRWLPHAAHNARATGAVEKARDIIERNFESGLRFRPVDSLDELNRLAQTWVRHFNARAEHSRHHQTRLAVWSTITPEQLRIAPPIEQCRELLTHHPESRKVTPQLTVSFGGADFSVASVPGVMVGERLMVSRNPYDADSAWVVDADETGDELLHPVPRVEKDAAGFPLDGNVIGESWARATRTVADDNRDTVQQVAMQATSQPEADARRKANAVPLGGSFNPWAGEEKGPGFTPLPKRGTALDVATTVAARAPVLLTHFEAARALIAAGLDAAHMDHALIRRDYPEGVPEADIEALHQRLSHRAGRGPLRVINSH